MSMNFPSFSEGLSLRAVVTVAPASDDGAHFPSFSEGLSLREALSKLMR